MRFETPFALMKRPKRSVVHSFSTRINSASLSSRTLALPMRFDEAVKGVQGVIQTATPFLIQVDDNERDLFQPAIEGTNTLLASVKKNVPEVRRVVVTSSFAAIINLGKGTWSGHVYTEADWNPLTYKEAAKKESPALRRTQLRRPWRRARPGILSSERSPHLTLPPSVHP